MPYNKYSLSGKDLSFFETDLIFFQLSQSDTGSQFLSD